LADRNNVGVSAQRFIRRDFLLASAGATLWLAACMEDDALGDNDQTPTTSNEGTSTLTTTSSTQATAESSDDEDLVRCDDAIAGGTYLGVLDFLDESGELGSKVNVGWDARLRFDLATLSSRTLIVDNNSFFIRTELPDQLDLTQPWSVKVTGWVENGKDFALSDLETFAQHEATVCLECSGNGKSSRFGLISAATFSGVLFADLLATIDRLPQGTRILIDGFDESSHPSTHSSPGASWIFTPEELIGTGAMLALRMNGSALPLDHGFPVRLIVPGWYGCCNIKWVREIRLVDENEPSTTHMREFASRTHQSGVPELARDFLPARMHFAAMPVRIEKWMIDGILRFRVVGIMWGGERRPSTLYLRDNEGGPLLPVEFCEGAQAVQTWAMFSTMWIPGQSGEYMLTMHVDDPSIPTQRLDTGYYARRVQITATKAG
jgi:DMSO/TMAO reductase YedYZ molybdopterin-dependent catalytic subunit